MRITYLLSLLFLSVTLHGHGRGQVVSKFNLRRRMIPMWFALLPAKIEL